MNHSTPALLFLVLLSAVPLGPTRFSTSAVAGEMRSIVLPHFEPDLPVAPGREDYQRVCVSCHSPRYVTMQPFFAQAKWEETVDKMVKVYGAQMDQGQRQAIVGYLVTIHGPGSRPEPAPADDDDIGLSASPKALPVIESAPSLNLSIDPAERVQQATRGKELFSQYCAACHGVTGRGDGVIAPVLPRKPKDLTAFRFSTELLSQVLWNGKRGTAMPSWRTLPPADLAALAVQVQSLHPAVSAGLAAASSLEKGKALFQQNCAPCHGASGDGRGASAVNLVPEPANFKLKQPDAEYVVQVVGDGIPGTGMPAWKSQLSATERQALADYIRSLFVAGP